MVNLTSARLFNAAGRFAQGHRRWAEAVRNGGSSLLVGGQDRISYLNPIGAGVKAGLKEGDIIVSIDGVRPGSALTWEVSNALDHARVAEVKRENATVTITLRPFGT